MNKTLKGDNKKFISFIFIPKINAKLYRLNGVKHKK